MQITHLSASDNSGGASRASYRLHQGLIAYKINSKYLTLQKVTSDKAVLQLRPRRASTLDKLTHRLSRLMGNTESRSWLPQGKDSFEIFSSGKARVFSDLIKELEVADIVNLHWIVGMLGHEDLTQVNRPIVWTLHDMHPFTGGCHFGGGCEKFVEQCGGCPQLASTQERDLSRRNWRSRSRALEKIDTDMLRIVTPSRWLGEECAKSSLMKRFKRNVIPYGIDTSVFTPRSRNLARELLDIPMDDRVVLFVADSLANYRKGADQLTRIISQVESVKNLHLLTMGRGSVETREGVRRTHVPHTSDDRLLSFFYSAADVFVITSRQDNLPNTVIEAMACGVPVVGSNVGGIPEMVIPNKSGFCSRLDDYESFASYIKQILIDDDLRSSLSNNARKAALSQFSLEKQAKAYTDLYRSILGTCSTTN